MRDAVLVMTKDLRLEWRSKVGIGQVLPFSLLVVLLFAFALDPERGVLDRVTSGLFWVVVLFSSVLTIERSFSVEAADGIFDALRLSGLAPAAIYAGKVAALVVQLLAIEAVLAAAVAVFYDTTFRTPVLTVGVALVATVGIAAAGAVYGAVAARLRSGTTLLPLLAPVLIGATRGFEVALGREAGPGWPWVALLGIFAVVYLTLGALLFRPLLEDV